MDSKLSSRKIPVKIYLRKSYLSHCFTNPINNRSSPQSNLFTSQNKVMGFTLQRVEVLY